MNFFTMSSLLLAASSPCFAYPTFHKRANVSSSDVEILQFALAAEHLESAFYKQALSNFTLQDFWNENFSEDLYHEVQKTAEDETTHVAFLEKTITEFDATPDPPCTYTFPVTSVPEFMITAKLLEDLGTSAYLGQVGNLQNKNLTTAAGTIVTVESRHAAVYQRALEGPDSAANRALDTPLGGVEVQSALQQFIEACPPGSDSKIIALPSLSLDTASLTGSISNFTRFANATSNAVTANSTIAFKTDLDLLTMSANASLVVEWVTSSDPLRTLAYPEGSDIVKSTVPPAIGKGQQYAVLKTLGGELKAATAIVQVQ